MEHYDDAVKEFNDIIRQDTEAYQVRFYLATAFEEKKDYDHAIEEFKKVPPSALAYYDALGHMAFDYKERVNRKKGSPFSRKRFPPNLSLLTRICILPPYMRLSNAITMA